jgi:hypothetical protein
LGIGAAYPAPGMTNTKEKALKVQIVERKGKPDF